MSSFLGNYVSSNLFQLSIYSFQETPFLKIKQNLLMVPSPSLFLFANFLIKPLLTSFFMTFFTL